MSKNALEIIPLGGLGEIGKNSILIKYETASLLIDAGLKFPEEEMLGVDLVLPDFSYLKSLPVKPLGIILTHGHEDHVGALPYLFKEFDFPVFGTPLTISLVRAKLEEFSITDRQLNTVKAGSTIKLGPFEVELINVNHSIPDGVGLYIKTPVGGIVHSGDFKLDPAPIDGSHTDLNRFSEIGKDEILVFLSDSTNAEVPGFSPSERLVGETLEKIFQQAKKKIIVASFASHLHRIKQIIELSKEFNRKIAISGRSMKESIEIGRQLHYFNLPDEMIVEPFNIKHFNPSEITVICTGSQGEPLSALHLLATEQHRHLGIDPDDTVIIAATPVPGNERAVSRIINDIFKMGAKVFYEDVSRVHVSGHGYQEELKLLISIIKPQFFVPIHGEYRHLVYHSLIAQEVGLRAENIFILENGDVLNVRPGSAYISKNIGAGQIFVDGLGIGDVSDLVLRDRMKLASDGIVVIVLGVKQPRGELIYGPEIISRGLIHPEDSNELYNQIKEAVLSFFFEAARFKLVERTALKEEIKNTVARTIFKLTKRKPIIVPLVIEL